MKVRLILVSLAVFFVGGCGSLSGQASPDRNVTAENEMLPEAVLLLKQYVAIPSVSGNELAAGTFLASLCREKGLFVRQFSSDETGYNFAASLYPLGTGKPNIIFLNHIDVVPPGNEDDWDFPPYDGTVAGGRLWGRGSIDNKGLAIVQLMAVASFAAEARKRELPFNVSLLSVSGEETGGARGAAIIASEYLEELNPVLIVGEGSCGFENMDFLGISQMVFGISVADKGMLWLELKVNTPEIGHASVNAGQYSNKILVDGLHKALTAKQPVIFNDASRMMFRDLGKLRGGLKGFVMRKIHWKLFRPALRKQLRKEPQLASLTGNSMSLSYLGNPDGGVNQHASEAFAMIDCRLLPGVDPDSFIEGIRDIIADSNISIRPVMKGPPASFNKENHYYALLSQSITTVFPGAVVVPVLFPATTDNNYFRGRGYPVYGLNPFILSMEQIGSIHNVNENISLEAVITGIEVFREFISGVMKEAVPD
jgi:carboxypeptidase PM20D1